MCRLELIINSYEKSLGNLLGAFSFSEFFENKKNRPGIPNRLFLVDKPND